MTDVNGVNQNPFAANISFAELNARMETAFQQEGMKIPSLTQEETKALNTSSKDELNDMMINAEMQIIIEQHSSPRNNEKIEHLELLISEIKKKLDPSAFNPNRAV